MRLDQSPQQLDRKIVIPDREQEFRRDRIAFNAAMPRAREHIHPPLQADFSRQRLGDLLPDPDDLDVERIKRQQRAAATERREQRRRIAAEVVGAHQFRTERRGHVLCCIVHDTAITRARERIDMTVAMIQQSTSSGAAGVVR